MNLDQAIQQDAECKLKLRSAILKHESLDAESIGRADRCVLGRWLHGEGRARYVSWPEYTIVFECHKAFHAEAGRIARLINAGQYIQAEKAMANGTAFAQACAAVAASITHLKKLVT